MSYTLYFFFEHTFNKNIMSVFLVKFLNIFSISNTTIKVYSGGAKPPTIKNFKNMLEIPEHTSTYL